MIDIYIIAYHLNSNNIYNPIETDLNTINLFLAHYILILLNTKKSFKSENNSIISNFDFMALLVLFVFANQKYISK